MNEYLDINKIITKLQDVDKLKLILLNENQRFIFDHLPKPGIVGHAKLSEPSNNLTKDRITMTKQKTCYSNRENLTFLLDGDPINSRIFQLLDVPLKRQLRNC